jgi:hypothetical protein
MSESEIPDLMRTLLAAGFEVTNVERKPNYLVSTLVRADEFGIRMKYILAYSGDQSISSADVEGLKKLSAHEGGSLVVVTSSANCANDVVILTKGELFAKFGGLISSTFPLEPEYGSQLIVLSRNRLPPGLKGAPDDLFEAYVHAGLQFLLRGRVLRYGQDRRFEAVSDGLALSSPLMLYDAKASDQCYEFSLTAIRQFADYVTQFHRRYESYVGRLYSFIVVSYEFQDESILQTRSQELYAACGVPLVCTAITHF